MRRSPANSTNRSLAAFGKLQHIQQDSSSDTSCFSRSGGTFVQGLLDGPRGGRGGDSVGATPLVVATP